MINQIDSFLRRLFPIARSITGNGNRRTLRIIYDLYDDKIVDYYLDNKISKRPVKLIQITQG